MVHWIPGSRFFRAWDVFYPFKLYAVLLLAVLMTAAVAEAASLGMILPLLEVVLKEDQSNSGILRYFASIARLLPGGSLLLSVCLIAFVAILVKNVLILVSVYMAKRFIANLRAYWSANVLENYLFAEYSWVEKHKHGVMVNNVVNEPLFAGKCLRDLVDVISRGTLSMMLVVVLLLDNWQVALLTGLVGAVLAVVQWQATHRYSYAIGRKRIALNQQITGVAAESLAGVRQLKIFCSEGTAVGLFKRGLDRLVGFHVRIGVVQELPRTIGEVVIVGLLLGVLFYCLTGMGYAAADIIPTIGLFVVCGQRLLTNLSRFLSQRISVISHWPSLELVSELARNLERREDVGGGREIQCVSDGVTFQDLSFSYGGGKTLFDRLNISFRKGRLIALVGRSGSGKSTICDLVMGLRSPTGGRVLVDQEDLTGLEIRSWRRLVGYVSQDTFLFNVSIRENILYGDLNASHEAVLWAARAAGVHDFIEALPEGYETVVGDRGVCLSGGQRQRVAVARALVRNPELLILDEATSALDSQSEERILDVVKDLRNEKLIIVVTHKLGWLSLCDEIYVMEEGRIVEHGSYEELMRLGGHFARLERSFFETKDETPVRSANP